MGCNKFSFRLGLHNELVLHCCRFCLNLPLYPEQRAPAPALGFPQPGSPVQSWTGVWLQPGWQLACLVAGVPAGGAGGLAQRRSPPVLRSSSTASSACTESCWLSLLVLPFLAAFPNIWMVLKILLPAAWNRWDCCYCWCVVPSTEPPLAVAHTGEYTFCYKYSIGQEFPFLLQPNTTKKQKLFNLELIGAVSRCI